jgi:hypothetical protein
MYDQLAALSPIMLALTAATPCMRGRLLDSDVRWAIISQSVDDRTPAERSAERGGAAAPDGNEGAPAVTDAVADTAMAGGGVRRLAKSRYDSISCFLSTDTPEAFNDVPCETDDATLHAMAAAGFDAPLSRHVAHLFARDPLVMFHGRIAEVAPAPAAVSCDASTAGELRSWLCDSERPYRTGGSSLRQLFKSKTRPVSLLCFYDAGPDVPPRKRFSSANGWTCSFK